jgi:hypothetical protein
VSLFADFTRHAFGASLGLTGLTITSAADADGRPVEVGNVISESVLS